MSDFHVYEPLQRWIRERVVETLRAGAPPALENPVTLTIYADKRDPVAPRAHVVWGEIPLCVKVVFEVKDDAGDWHYAAAAFPIQDIEHGCHLATDVEMLWHRFIEHVRSRA